jgi:hypothetical protein
MKRQQENQFKVPGSEFNGSRWYSSFGPREKSESDPLGAGSDQKTCIVYVRRRETPQGGEQR